MKFSVKKGDYVKIIAGNDRGKTAQILAVDTEKGRVYVEGKDVGSVTKAVKARKASDKGGLITRAKTVDVSNVMPVCANCGKPTRVRHGVSDGKKVRICAKCGAVLETKKAKEEKKVKSTVRKRTKKPTEVVNSAPLTDAVGGTNPAMNAALGIPPDVTETVLPAETEEPV